ncbi:hypothetical protein OEA41_000270 [Lepraria neglecta]|uniref:Uncharacterized protein n=1 Tax=Lepraria neglecta TaxID=209136 RepID=A0AAE0DPM6_9LECA|nr:hypothetical protein OEA41_000270 [Lepraria neglecta]
MLGVASLRARFEQQGEDTSPPSRGRSPAGSVTSSSSRPLSKVRTSFVAVEPSGHMTSELGLKGLDGVNEAVAGDSTETSKPAITGMNGEAMDKPKTNGNGVHPLDTANPAINVTEAQSPAKSKPASKPEAATGAATNANPDKPVSTAEDDTAGMLPADPKDEGAVSGGAALADETPGLGSILKGSPFEEKEAKKAGISKPSKSTAAAATSQPSKPQTKAQITGPVNGKPKEAQTTKSAPSQPTTAQAKAPVASATNDKAKEAQAAKPAPEPKPKAAPPASIETQPAAASAPSTAPEASKTKPQKTATSAPRTPTSATGTGKQPLSKAASPVKAASPKAVPSKEPKKEVAKDSRKPASRLSGVSKPPIAPMSKPTQPASTSTTKPVKKPEPMASALTKPKPKSPTRPVRLPASATAPTAASAAKLDGAPPSIGDRRPMNMASVIRGRATSNPKPPGPKASRASLPTGSKPLEKVKAPKSRMSMAGAPAPPGSFLERMMRPTQSSAQKTHEKVELKTPPKKSHRIRPKRTSEGSEKSKSEHGESKVEQPKEPAAEATQPPAEPSDTQSTNGANENTNEPDSAPPAEYTVQ